MRAIAVLLIACAAASAHAQQSLSAAGDFDDDGKPDAVELNIADGRYQLIVKLGGRLGAPIVLGSGEAARAGDFLEVRHGGTFKNPPTRRNPNPGETTLAQDVFVYGKKDGQKSVWIYAGSSFGSIPLL